MEKPLNDPALSVSLGREATELDYLFARAGKMIDGTFGDWFSKVNPALVGSYLNAGAFLQPSVRAGSVEDVAVRIANAISEVGEALVKVAQSLDREV